MEVENRGLEPREDDSEPREGDSEPREDDSEPREGDSEPREDDSEPRDRRLERIFYALPLTFSRMILFCGVFRLTYDGIWP